MVYAMPDTTAASNAAKSGKGLESKDGCMAIYAPTRHRIVEATLTKLIFSFRKMPARMASDLLIQEHSLHPNNPYLFPSPATGTMYSPETVARIHKRLLKDAGLEDCRFHDLRHTFATLALQNGVDIKTLSGMLGHYSSGFTLDTYTHVTRKMQEEAAEKMGQFMEMKL